jgi:hypothetical protein
MLGMYNIATKVGDGDVIVGMFGVGNVLTHVGDGMSAALMVSVGANFLTKVGKVKILAVPPPIIKAALKPFPTWVNILA